MGDRTYAEVVIRKEYWPVLAADEVSRRTLDDYLDVSPQEFDRSDTILFIHYEANYGEIPGVTNILNEMRIDYNLNWGRGSEYNPGSNYVRFSSDGFPDSVEIYDCSDGMIEIAPLLDAIENQKATIEDIKGMLNTAAARFTVPHGNERNILKVPLREFTDEEKVQIMEYKMRKGDVK